MRTDQPTAEQGRPSHPLTPLALDLTDDAVTLFAHRSEQGWTEIKRVPTNAPDFLDRVADLRTEARIRDETGAPITLWLPKEQVLVKSYDLPGDGPDARQSAREQLAEETPYGAAELMVALGPYDQGAPTLVLGALSQTVMEAREYARKWGFRPGPVSTRVAADQFGSGIPIFQAPEAASLRVMRRSAIFGMAACVVGAALLGIFALGQMVQPVAAPKLEGVQNGGMIFTVVLVPDEMPQLAATPLRPVGKGSAQTLAIQKALITQPSNDPALTEQRGVPLHLAGTVELPIPRTRPRLKVGPAPQLPARARPGRLRLAAVLPRRKPVQQTLAAIESVRQAGLAQTLTKTSIGTNPRPHPESPPAEDVLVASLQPDPVLPPTPSADQTPVLPAVLPAQRPSSVPEQAVDSDVEDLAPTARAPVTIEAEPKPRPEVSSPEPSATQQVAAATASSTPTPSASLVAPVLQPRAPQIPLPEIAVANTEPEVEIETPTQYAALSAPRPLVRPRELEKQPVVRQPSSLVLKDNAPRTVRSAAAEVGLQLGQTNLIGVLQGTNGRQALVQLQDGGYQKVARGDVVDGWRVHSIGRETMRLSRRGQNRTLLLISR